jgi:hypothetical protein
MGNKAIPIFQQVVKEDTELFIKAQVQITATMYMMREAIVWFNTQLANISYFASGQGKRKADTEDGRRKWVRKEWESLCVFFWVYIFPLRLWFSFRFIIFVWVYIRNNSSFRQKHPGVPDSSDGSDGTSYPLTENYMLPVAQATGPSLLNWCSAGSTWEHLKSQ